MSPMTARHTEITSSSDSYMTYNALKTQSFARPTLSSTQLLRTTVTSGTEFYAVVRLLRFTQELDDFGSFAQQIPAIQDISILLHVMIM